MVTQVASHWDTHRPKGFNGSNVRHAIQRLRITAERLALRPSQLHTLPIEGIQRRYGPWVARLSELLTSSKPTYDYFPWKTWQPVPPIQIHRVLDNPTRKWEECTLELIEDLDQIALKTHLKLIELTWTIQFQPEATIALPIRFRTPRYLRTEQGHHRTALIQLMGAIASLESTFKKSPFVSGWSIAVTGTLSMGIDRLTLFEFSMDAEHERQLEALANQILVPLTRYQWAPHWAPELGFKDAQHPPHKDTHYLHSILPHPGPQRPLFTLTRPYGISLPPQAPQIEAVMAPWWKEKSPIAETQYYRYQDSQKRWLWVARNGKTSEARGIYG